MSAARRESRSAPGALLRVEGARSAAALWAVAIAVGLVLYGPALDGAFISDDHNYIAGNPYVHDLSLESLGEMLDPTGVLTVMVENYAPVHLLLHSFEWQVFGADVRGHHVTNVILHALCAVLLAALYRRSGLAAAAAVLGGALFLVHPGNVEAVAWMSQLKSPAALALALGALLWIPRRPALATVLFALALLAKPSALFAWPVLIMQTWLDGGGLPTRAEPERWRSWLWPAAWGVVFVAFAWVEVAAFAVTAGAAPSPHGELPGRLVSGTAVGARYVALALFSAGLSTFQEPPAVESFLDPWWLAGAGLLLAAAVRIVVVLRRRSPEVLFWALLAASYAPVSGLLSLPFPMADRYLYNLLPGLIGLVLWWARDVGEWPAVSALGAKAPRAALALGVACALFFAVRTNDRAGIWQSTSRVMADAEVHYPRGAAYHLRSSRDAARRRDRAATLAHLEFLHSRGLVRLEDLVLDPDLDFLHRDPEFDRMRREVADRILAGMRSHPKPTQLQQHTISLAHRARGEDAQALAALERARELGGPIDERVEADLRQLRLRALRRRE